MSTGPGGEDVRSFYDRVASGYAQVLPDTAFEAPLDLGMLDQFVSLLPSAAAVLDAGCGTGANLLAFADRARPAGIDFSPEAVRWCRSRGLPDTAVASAAALPFPLAKGAAKPFPFTMPLCPFASAGVDEGPASGSPSESVESASLSVSLMCVAGAGVLLYGWCWCWWCWWWWWSSGLSSERSMEVTELRLSTRGLLRAL